MFYQIFLSPEVKRWAIITYEHGIYELPHGFPNNLRLRTSDENGCIHCGMAVDLPDGEVNPITKALVAN